MTPRLTRGEAIGLLERVVERTGGAHRYVSQYGRLCVYVERSGATPRCASCIVALALEIHGVSMHDMAQWDNAMFSGGQPGINDGLASFDSIYRNPKFKLARWMDEAAAVAFLAAQVAQDVGKPYGEALYAAREAPETFEQWADQCAQPSEQWHAHTGAITA